MKISLVGTLSEIFWLSCFRRTLLRIFVTATNTAASKSLKYEHRSVMLSA